MSSKWTARATASDTVNFTCHNYKSHGNRNPRVCLADVKNLRSQGNPPKHCTNSSDHPLLYSNAKGWRAARSTWDAECNRPLTETRRSLHWQATGAREHTRALVEHPPGRSRCGHVLAPCAVTPTMAGGGPWTLERRRPAVRQPQSQSFNL